MIFKNEIVFKKLKKVKNELSIVCKKLKSRIQNFLIITQTKKTQSKADASQIKILNASEKLSKT